MKVLAANIMEVKINPYTITSSRAKHPVRMIEGGMYLTEELDREYSVGGDMGIFGLNAKDYEIFKANLKEVEVESR